MRSLSLAVIDGFCSRVFVKDYVVLSKALQVLKVAARKMAGRDSVDPQRQLACQQLPRAASLQRPKMSK